MLFILPNSFTSDQCSFLIDLYEKNNHLAGEWRDTYPLALAGPKGTVSFIDSSILEQMKNYFCNFFNNYIHRMEIVKWPTDSFQPPHFDTSKSYTSLASITYLNDDFQGGQTCMESEKLCVNPKTGTTFFFDGQRYEHHVTPVKNGTRYTFAVWYANDPSYSVSTKIVHS